MIRGPKNIADFRDNDHNYVDPQPPCPVAPEPFTGPPLESVTKLLGDCWPFIGPHVERWKLGAAADHAIENAGAVVNAKLGREDVDVVRAGIIGAADKIRDDAANRGTGVHSLFEKLMADEELDIYDEASEAWRYIEQVRQVVAKVKAAGIVVVASEVIVFSRTRCYAGQFDSVLRYPDGRHIKADYKTRGDKPSAALRKPSEAAQIGGYSSADYWMIEGDDGPCRMAPLEIDGGLIISLTETDHRFYGVDINHARGTWAACLAWRDAKADTPTAFTAPVANLADLVGTPPVVQLEDPERPFTDDAPARTVNHDFRTSTPDWTPPEEGKDYGVDKARAMLERKAAELNLGSLGLNIVTAWVMDGSNAGRPWRIADEGTGTARRLAIYGAAMRLAAWDGLTDLNAYTLLDFILDGDSPPDVGAALGTLTTNQALTLSGLADLLLAGATIHDITAA